MICVHYHTSCFFLSSFGFQWYGFMMKFGIQHIDHISNFPDNLNISQPTLGFPMFPSDPWVSTNTPSVAPGDDPEFCQLDICKAAGLVTHFAGFKFCRAVKKVDKQLAVLKAVLMRHQECTVSRNIYKYLQSFCGCGIVLVLGCVFLFSGLVGMGNS